MTSTFDVCGTSAGYQRHYRRGEAACAPCRKARAEKQALRRRDPAVRADESSRAAARSRALWRLADEHPDRFRELFIEEVSS